MKNSVEALLEHDHESLDQLFVELDLALTNLTTRAPSNCSISFGRASPCIFALNTCIYFPP